MTTTYRRGQVLTSLLLLLYFIGAPLAASAQHALPVIRANSDKVDIVDGALQKKGAWTVQPTLALDTYRVERASKKKRVTFRTDLDSITFDVEPGKEYDFVILLKNKYRCTTRISALRAGYRRLAPAQNKAFDEIPFTLGKGDKIHIQGRINGSDPLDLLFDTGANAVVVYPSALEKKVQIAWNSTAQNSGYGGVNTLKVGDDNQLDIAGLRWEHEDIVLVEKQADIGDGIVGYNVFSDKVVEIDYGRKVLRVYDALPKRLGAYRKVDTRFQEDLPTIKATLNTGSAAVTDWFVFDTGSDSALHLNYAFAAGNKLAGTMRKIGTTRSGGVGDRWIENDRVLLPELVIAGAVLPNIAIDMATAEEGFSLRSTFGMQVLKQFDTLLDFPRQQIYLKPAGASSQGLRSPPPR